MEYKGVDLSVLLQGVAGVTGMLDGFAGWAFRGDGNIQKWQAEGRFDPANPTRYPAYPRLEDLSNSVTPNIVSSDFWVQDASYIRLRTLQLGYTFPARLLKNTPIHKLRLYATATNLLTFTEFKSYSPELTPGSYPESRQYVFGVNVSF